MRERLENSLLSWEQYLGIGWAEFGKNFKTFLWVAFLVSLLKYLLLPGIESNIFMTTIEMFVILTVPQAIEYSIRERTIDANILLQNFVSKFFTALAVSIVFHSLLKIFFSSPIDLLYTTIYIFAILLLPSIFAWSWLVLIFCSIVIRNCSLNAFKYSLNLVRNRWWEFLGRSLFITLIFCLFLIALLYKFGILFLFLKGYTFFGGQQKVITQIIPDSIFSLISYYVMTVYTVMFLNLDYTRHPQS